ncbi:hypothetical protein D3C75_1122840 [compost metagenome]
MGCVEYSLHFLPTIAFLTFRHVIVGEDQVVDDGFSVSELLEQVVALEEAVVTECSVSRHESLHHRRVLFHEVVHARRAVDDQLIGEAHFASHVLLVVLDERFTERPMLIHHWHADRGIGIKHLLR